MVPLMVVVGLCYVYLLSMVVVLDLEGLGPFSLVGGPGPLHKAPLYVPFMWSFHVVPLCGPFMLSLHVVPSYGTVLHDSKVAQSQGSDTSCNPAKSWNGHFPSY